jgi:hypothetical protein
MPFFSIFGAKLISMDQPVSIMHLQRQPTKSKTLIHSKQWGKGWVKYDYFAGTAIARLKQSEYLFITKGKLKQETYIHDKYTKELVGLMTFNAIRTRATIRLSSNQVFIFRNFAPFLFRSQITEYKNPLVTYKASISGGTVRSYTNDEILVLAGMFARNFYIVYGVIFIGALLTAIAYGIH